MFRDLHKEFKVLIRRGGTLPQGSWKYERGGGRGHIAGLEQITE